MRANGALSYNTIYTHTFTAHFSESLVSIAAFHLSTIIILYSSISFFAFKAFAFAANVSIIKLSSVNDLSPETKAFSDLQSPVFC